MGKARPIEKDKSIITYELKSQDKKKIKHNVDKSRLIGERQSNLNKQDKHTTEGNFTPMVSEKIGKDIFKAVAATRNNKVLHEESPIATTRDICTSFYAKGTSGPEPLVEQRSKETEDNFTPMCQKRLESTSSKQ